MLVQSIWDSLIPNQGRRKRVGIGSGGAKERYSVYTSKTDLSYCDKYCCVLTKISVLEFLSTQVSHISHAPFMWPCYLVRLNK